MLAKFNLLLFSLALLFIAGCGSNTKPVTGTVTLDGKPLEGASVVFAPSEGGRTNSVATTDSSGAYALQYTSKEAGAMVGDYKVLIFKPKATDKGEVETLPRKYNEESTLTATVTNDGENSFNFDLESK